jgi:hypothetical protein
MDSAKTNKIAFRITGILFSIFLLLGGYGIYDNGQHVKGWIGLIAGISILLMVTTSNFPKWWSWIAIFSILLISVCLIGYMSIHQKL